MKKKYSLKKNDKKISTSIKKTKKNTDRLLKVNVKTAKGRKISSTNSKLVKDFSYKYYLQEEQINKLKLNEKLNIQRKK